MSIGKNLCIIGRSLINITPKAASISITMIVVALVGQNEASSTFRTIQNVLLSFYRISKKKYLPEFSTAACQTDAFNN